MSGFTEAQPAGHPGGCMHEFAGAGWPAHRSGPPLPLVILAAVVAFWVFPPLGLAALAYLVWRFARNRGGCAVRRDGCGRGGWGGAGRPSSGATAFEERRRETLKALEEEAKAFDDFERRRREAHDREAFDRFMAERDAPKGPDEPK